ncbi:hypothetical protein ACIRP0_31685 [Streptomyces sp. NPDC101733]|uniref:hypothetical protein n=1 Tax=unclassified Streptomyces TaxID=2593676 RepID=UPI0038153487
MAAPAHRTEAGEFDEPWYGAPSPALLARADQGFARFLARFPARMEADPDDEIEGVS